MEERHWEISGNLSDEKTGIPNYTLFQTMICLVKQYYDEVFGLNRMNKIDFLVDNATEGSGYTPISTVVLGKIVVIKLNIGPSASPEQIVYQFTHELTHVVFRAYFGINKPLANEEEEAICTAASLIVGNKLFPNSFSAYEKYAECHPRIGYRNGVTLAKKISYDMNLLRTIIENYRLEINQSSKG